MEKPTEKPLEPPANKSPLHCMACEGKGEVPSIMGELRPCSRCRPGEFADWYAAGVKKEKAQE